MKVPNIRTSEWVSLGHPDKVADYISSYILDYYLKFDPKVRYAVEVQIKDNYVTLGGEVTSTIKLSENEYAGLVREAVAAIGYTHDYAEYWGKDNALDCDNLIVTVHISSQSPDIAQGVDREGWGDQGIFWGMAVDSKTTDNMPEDYYIARQLGQCIYGWALSRRYAIGLDIKTQIEMTDDKVTKVIVAAPMKDDYTPRIMDIIGDVVGEGDYEVIINGTGAYVRHASMGDCGTTGRKLAVDFYGGNCRIGGGSPWTKDGTKADVALNIYARKLAVAAVKEKDNLKTCFVSISSCIGKKDIRIVFYNDKMEPIGTRVDSRPSLEIIEELGLRKPVFAYKCRWGLFANPKA